MRRFVSALRRSQAGSTAMEYALILPIFISLLIGGLCAGNLAFAINSLHYAVQDAARCAAVKTTICTGTSTTIDYAKAHYSGPKISPTFNYSTSGCGHTVSASGSYPIILAAATINVPVSASACFP